jgi:hypothetical protein
MRAQRTWTEIKSILLASVVACLVWVWAEGESVATRPVTVGVLFPEDSGGPIVIRPEDPTWKGVVRVRLEGTTRAVDAAANALGAPRRLLPGSRGMPTEPGSHRVIDLREAVSDLTDLKAIGNVVAEVEPRQVVVNVVRMVARELPVRVELGAEVSIDGDPVPTPAVVLVRIPESAAALLGEGAQAVAQVDREELQRIRGDGPQTVTALVRPPASLAGLEPVLVVPDRVSVALRVKKKVETLTLPSVPVWVSLPPTEGTRWDVVVLDKFLSDVTLSGASEDIRRVRSGEAVVKAVVELTTDDLEKAVVSKQASFTGAPPALACSAANQAIRLKITKRPVPGENGAAGSPSPPSPGL